MKKKLENWFLSENHKREIRNRKCNKCKIFKKFSEFRLPDHVCRKCRNKIVKNFLPYRFHSYKYHSKKRNIEFNLTREQFLSFWKKPCYYCGQEIKTIGLDRINNEEGYILHNIIACCSYCNRMKFNYTQLEFIERCTLIASRFT